MNHGLIYVKAINSKPPRCSEGQLILSSDHVCIFGRIFYEWGWVMAIINGSVWVHQWFPFYQVHIAGSSFIQINKGVAVWPLSLCGEHCVVLPIFHYLFYITECVFYSCYLNTNQHAYIGAYSMVRPGEIHCIKNECLIKKHVKKGHIAFWGSAGLHKNKKWRCLLNTYSIAPLLECFAKDCIYIGNRFHQF